MTLHRTANFRVKLLNSDIEQTRRGIVLLVVLLVLLGIVNKFCIPFGIKKR